MKTNGFHTFTISHRGRTVSVSDVPAIIIAGDVRHPPRVSRTLNRVVRRLLEEMGPGETRTISYPEGDHS